LHKGLVLWQGPSFRNVAGTQAGDTGR
jgi:hypothetical protein